MGSTKVKRKVSKLRARARRRKQIIKLGRMTSLKKSGIGSSDQNQSKSTIQ